MQNKNVVHLTGGIVRIRESKNMINMTIATTVTGMNTAYPEITFFDKSKTEGFRVGNRVTIDGHIQVYFSEEDGKRTYRQTIVGDRIIKTRRVLAPFIEDETVSKTDGGIKPDENIAFVFGTVRHIYEAPNGVVVLNILVTDNDHQNRCEVACFKRQAEVAKTLQDGDFVMIGGSIQTKRNPSGKSVQNIACRDILKCEK